MKEILPIIEKETKGKCFQSQKYSIDVEKLSTLEYKNKEKEIIFEDKGEIGGPKTVYSLSSEVAKWQNHDPLFKYFLDGSRRVYKIADILYGDKVYPIIAGQIGVGCCNRFNKKINRELFVKENVLVFPTIANPNNGNLDQFFENLKNKINGEALNKKNLNFKIHKILSYKTNTDKDLSDTGVAKVQDRMIELEKEVVANLVKSNLLSSSEYLIKDGSLEYQEYKSNKNSIVADFDKKYSYAKIKNNYTYVVGVSKSFNSALAQTKNKDCIAQDIVELKIGERTPAYMCGCANTGDEKFSIWYLRIRDAKYCKSPFDGVLKVEKLLSDEEKNNGGLDPDEINAISANLVMERNPVCYGSDTRWANHLYPIYLTETFVKSQYLSDTFFLNIF